MQESHGNGSLFSDQEWSRITESLRLSPRERQVTQGVLEDLKESAIARRLGISRHTVHTHIERIYHKLTVSSRVQLVVRVVAEYRSMNDFSGIGDQPVRKGEGECQNPSTW